MQDAIAEVEKGMSQREASERFQVPRSTLQGYLSGKSTLASRSGCPLLTLEEEDEFATFLIEVGKIGYPHTCAQVLAKVQEMVNHKGKTTVVTRGWWQSFRKRHSELTLKSAIPLSIARAKASDCEVIDKYFCMLKMCLDEYSLLDEPSRIYNCDETGLPLNPTCHKVVVKKGSCNPNYITGNTKMQITVLACTNAAGVAIPPLVVLNKKSMNTQIAKGEVPGTKYGLSPNGWINHELFTSWLTDHFLLYANRERPVLLLLDGHSSHYSPPTVTLAAENGVILFTLPPNTTHLTQPLDRTCFGPLKTAWREACHKFRCANPTRAITIYDFNMLFATAWYKAMSMPNIIAGYKATGIYPYDSSVFHHSLNQMETNLKSKTILERTGLSYIPLYKTSPSSTGKALSIAKMPGPTSKIPLYSTSQSSTTRALSSPASNISLYSPSPSSTRRALSSTKTTPGPTGNIALRQKSSISGFLIKPPPPSTLPTKKAKSSGLIHTSKENMELVREKQRAKEEMERKREERRMEREKKRMEREKKAQQRAPEKESGKMCYMLNDIVHLQPQNCTA